LIIRKSPAEIDKIAASGAILVKTLRLLERQLRPGVTTAELDAAAERFIRSQGAEPSFKGYRGFPGSICASPNSMIVHGIPGPHELERADIVSLDVGVTLDGWVSDAARTFAVGSVSAQASHLLEATERALFAGIEQCVAGNRLGDVSHAIQASAEQEGLQIVRALVGHGVGRSMHEDPQIPNFGKPRTGPRLENGMVFAIEPMTTIGTTEISQADDGWSIYSKDGSLAAHFEFTVAIVAGGPRILTPWHLSDREDAADSELANIPDRARVG
jgi:methionyl aminopeptidase